MVNEFDGSGLALAYVSVCASGIDCRVTSFAETGIPSSTLAFRRPTFDSRLVYTCWPNNCVFFTEPIKSSRRWSVNESTKLCRCVPIFLGNFVKLRSIAVKGISCFNDGFIFKGSKRRSILFCEFVNNCYYISFNQCLLHYYLYQYEIICK